MIGPEPEPGSGSQLRVESGEEVLDTVAPFRDRFALMRRHVGQGLAARFPRTTRASGVILLAAACAVWGSVETHRSDQQDAARAARGTVLLRLLGSGTVSQDPHGVVKTDPRGAAARAETFGSLAVIVRNDGPVPVDILAAAVHDTGVHFLLSTPPVVVQPGQPTFITVPVDVDCTDPGLPRHLGALTLEVRDPVGRVVKVTLPGPPPASQDAAAATGDYYSLCGAAQTSITPDVASDRLFTAATAANRTFSYRVTVTGLPDRAQVLQAAAGGTAGSPGTRVTTDLAAPAPLTAGIATAVVITVHIDDCARVGAMLGSSETGPNTTALGIGTQLIGAVLDVTPGGRRFPQTPVVLAGPTSSKYSADILTQFLLACPNLE